MLKVCENSVKIKSGDLMLKDKSANQKDMHVCINCDLGIKEDIKLSLLQCPFTCTNAIQNRIFYIRRLPDGSYVIEDVQQILVNLLDGSCNGLDRDVWFLYGIWNMEFRVFVTFSTILRLSRE